MERHTLPLYSVLQALRTPLAALLNAALPKKFGFHAIVRLGWLNKKNVPFNRMPVSTSVAGMPDVDGCPCLTRREKRSPNGSQRQTSRVLTGTWREQ